MNQKDKNYWKLWVSSSD